MSALKVHAYFFKIISSLLFIVQTGLCSQNILADYTPADYSSYSSQTPYSTNHSEVFTQEIFSWVAANFTPIGSAVSIIHRICRGPSAFYVDLIFGLGSFFWGMSGGWGVYIDSSSAFQGYFSAVSFVAAGIHAGLLVESAITMCKSKENCKKPNQENKEADSENEVDLEKGESFQSKPEAKIEEKLNEEA